MMKVAAQSWQRTLYIMFFAELITAIGFSSIFPFLPLYVKALGTSSHFAIDLLTGLVFSAQAFTMMVASPVWGMLADRYGRKLMVERAMFGGAVILVLMAFVRSAEELVALRAIQGLITGTIGAANALVASVAPRERIGYAMGLLQMGLGVGVAVGPMLGGTLADAYGYRVAFYVTAGFLLVAGLVVLFGVDEQFEANSHANKSGDNCFRQWRRILSTRGVVTVYGLRFVNQLGRMMFLPIVPLFVEKLLAATPRLNTFTGLIVGAASATTTLSALYLGRWGDRWGHRLILMACFFASFVLYLLQSQVTAGWQLLGLQALAGVALGGIIPSLSALLALYTEAGEEGAVYGLDNSINAGARALAPMFGVSVALYFGLRATFVTAALLYFIASLVAVLALSRDTVTESSLQPQQAEKTRVSSS